MRKILVLTGPTAVGKSAVADAICCSLEPAFQIVNADSKQVYKELPVLTAQPLLSGDSFLYGHVSVFSKKRYSTAVWVEECLGVVRTIWDCDRVPLLVGGNPLYLHCLTHGLSILPELKSEVLQDLVTEYKKMGRDEFIQFASLHYKIPSTFEKLDSYRLLRNIAYFQQTGKSMDVLYRESKLLKQEFDSVEILALVPERAKIYQKIDQRFLEMLNNGVIKEVKALMQDGRNYQKPEVMTIHGLSEVSSYLHGEISFDEMVRVAQKNIRNYAKRQTTWFKNKFSDIKFFSDGEQILDYIATRS